MTRGRVPSAQAVSVLDALAAQPSQWRHGYDLCAELGLKSGSLYPILIRLADRGLMEAIWEAGPPGKPPRHLYRLTTAGLDAVRTQVTQPAPKRRARVHNQPSVLPAGSGGI